MMKAVQQIMLGSVVSNRAQALWALQRIKAAGYDAIELNRFMIHPSAFVVRFLTRTAGMPTGNSGKLNWLSLVKESGLSVAALHTDLGSLEREMDSIATEANSFGTDKIVVTGMYRFDYSNEKTVRSLTERLNKAGEAINKYGLSLLYHNHNVELLQVEAGLCAFDILVDGTDPELVGFEFDSYWFVDGGADALAWMNKLGPRMKLWHINDRGSRQNGPAMTPILKTDSMELGCGNMNLVALKEAAMANGIEAVVLESHKNWVDKDPIKSIELSAEWLNKHF